MSVNSFLAPYERIVDFAVIDRDFDAAHEELTPKGTPRRKVIERNFADAIRLLYRRTTFTVGGAQITFPNWLFQALGVTAQDLRVDGNELTLASTGHVAPGRARRRGRGPGRLGGLPAAAAGRSISASSCRREALARERAARPVRAARRRAAPRAAPAPAAGLEWHRRVEPYQRDARPTGRRPRRCSAGRPST